MLSLSNTVRVIVRLALTLAIALLIYLPVYRPVQLRWGATNEEIARAMPGDEIQPNPIFNATRAVTIDAPPERIWPWLVQIGYHRAGWYSALDWVDNGGVPSASRIIPDLQHIEAGDAIPVAERDVPVPGVPDINNWVVAVEPDRYLLVTTDNSQDSWLWALEPVSGQQTRLIWRMRWGPYDWTSPYVVLQTASDLGDFVVTRNILLSIKERAEGRPIESLAASTPQVLLWMAVFGAFLASLVGMVFRRDWLRPLAAVAVTGAVTLLLVFAMPPLWVDALAAATVYVWLLWLGRERRSAERLVLRRIH